MTTPTRQDQLVAAAVESLHPEYRQVLLKTYFQGHSASEAAQALGLPLPVVKRRIYEALRQLRRHMAQDGLLPRAAGDQRLLPA